MPEDITILVLGTVSKQSKISADITVATISELCEVINNKSTYWIKGDLAFTKYIKPAIKIIFDTWFNWKMRQKGWSNPNYRNKPAIGFITDNEKNCHLLIKQRSEKKTVEIEKNNNLSPAEKWLIWVEFVRQFSTANWKKGVYHIIKFENKTYHCCIYSYVSKCKCMFKKCQENKNVTWPYRHMDTCKLENYQYIIMLDWFEKGNYIRTIKFSTILF